MLQGQTPGSRSQIISAPPAPAHCCRLSSSITWKRRVEILRLLSLNLILLTSRTLSNMTHLMLSEIQPRFPPIFYIFSLSNMVRFYINLYIYIFSPYFKTLGCTGYPASLPFYSSNIWRHTGFDCRISGRLPVHNNRKGKKSGRKCTRHLFLK